MEEEPYEETGFLGSVTTCNQLTVHSKTDQNMNLQTQLYLDQEDVSTVLEYLQLRPVARAKALYFQSLLSKEQVIC